MISPGLEALAVPLDTLHPFPGNPRVGDVEAVRKSIRRFGQQKPVVYHLRNRKRIIIAGNHTYLAALAEDWPELAAAEFVGSKKEADAYALADNRTGDLGTYDYDALLNLIGTVGDPELLEASSYSTEDVAALQRIAEEAAGTDTSGRSGSLLALSDVTVGDPEHVVAWGDVYRIGAHVLVVADVMTDWWLWTPYLTDPETLFVPYPGPYAALTVKAESRPMVLVQPDPFLAGHLLDKYAAVRGPDSITIEEEGPAVTMDVDA